MSLGKRICQSSQPMCLLGEVRPQTISNYNIRPMALHDKNGVRIHNEPIKAHQHFQKSMLLEYITQLLDINEGKRSQQCMTHGHDLHILGVSYADTSK